MVMKDLVILEYFDETASALPPGVVHYNLCEIGEFDFSKRTVRRRISELAERGYLENVDERRGYYRLTDRGRRFVRGED